VTGHQNGCVVERENFRAHVVEDVAIGAAVAERAADAAREKRVAGKERRAEEEARRTVGVTGRVQHPDRGVVTERQLFAVVNRQRALGERADRGHVGTMHHDLGLGKRFGDLAGRVAMVRVLVGDQNVAQSVRPFADGAHEVLRNPRRIDQGCGATVFEKEEVAVRGVRILRMVTHVGRHAHVRFPALRGRVGELAGIEAQSRADRPALFLARDAVATGPGLYIVEAEAGFRRDLCVTDPRAAFGLAQYVAKFIFEHRDLCGATGGNSPAVETPGMERLIIIGSGPAGLTAAIYAARANLAPRVFAGAQYGGQLMFTTEVENYPGFPNGILGPELMDHFRAQAERFGAKIENVDVTSVDFSRRPFRVRADDIDYEADSVIVATGASARWLGIPGEEHLRGRGVSTCATCDGAFFRERHIVVVGGGDSAMEEALFLTRFGSRVTVIHRRDSLRASKIMADRAMGHPKIEFIWNTSVEEAKGEHHLQALVLQDHKSGERREFAADALFIAIGHDPNTAIFKDQLELDSVGYIVSPDGVHTSVPGVFVAGDVYDIRYKQAITAAGMGCRASMDAEKYLEELDAERSAGGLLAATS